MHCPRLDIRYRLIATIAFWLVPALAVAQGITPDQIADLKTVTAAAISPSGDFIAYTVRVPRADGDEPGRSHTELWVVQADGSGPQALVQAPNSASQPSWSPDGRQVMFVATLADLHARPQVYGVDRQGGTPTRMTNAPDGVMVYAWSPSGNAIAYTSRDPLPEGVTADRARGFDQWVAGENPRHVRLWLEELGSGTRTPLTPERHTVWAFEWAPDGERLAVQMTMSTDIDDSYMFRRLHTVSIDGSHPTMLGRTPGKLGGMAFSPDGRSLAFIGAVSQNDPIAQSIFVVASDGGAMTNLTEDYEGTVTWLEWESDDRIVFLANEGTRTSLNSLVRSSGVIEPIAGGEREVLTSVHFDSGRRRFAAITNTAQYPSELHLGTGSALSRVTNHNPWLDDVELARQETIAWHHDDGTRIEGVLVYPLGYREGDRYPLTVLPHGGPEGISSDGWTTGALYPVQLLAANGYAILMPNYRGSGGRGVAFSKADHRDLGGKEFEDVIAGIDHLAETGLVDPERVGISGTSYGGYFSAWATARHPDRFKAGITFAGISNWMSFTGTTDIPYEMSLVHWDLWWSDNPGLAWDRSPVAHVDEGTSPTLIGHGAADARVHPAQSYELHTALKLKDVPTGLVVYPREPHGLLERAHQLDFMKRVLDWMNEHVKGGPPATS